LVIEDKPSRMPLKKLLIQLLFFRKKININETKIMKVPLVAIVGRSNVGKSTLFNALTESNKAEAANFPFCTIEPNIGVVNVPDKRLDILADLVKPEKVIPATVEILDIAGLVKGASKGEGLGNQFLSNIRETNAIIHVLRCYENDNISHVEGSVDPLRDKEIIDFELCNFHPLDNTKTIQVKTEDFIKFIKTITNVQLIDLKTKEITSI